MLPVLLPIQGKLQKHQAFEAEVVANKDRIFSTIAMGQGEDTCSGAPIKEINLGIPAQVTVFSLPGNNWHLAANQRPQECLFH